MPRMKELLRKLRIGGGASISEHLNRNLASCSSASGSPTSTIATDDKGVDFNLLEDDYQMQLAMAISVSDSDSHKDPDSAQIDAAKQMSLGYGASGTDTEALVQFQSLRYWNYNVIDYEEKVMDGFYDVYGITSKKGKMPLLVDLQNKPISENVDCEVILVNRIDDFELKHLEEKACTLCDECCVSEKGLILGGLPQKLANIVVNRMGGAVGSTDKISRSWAMRSRKLQDSLGTVVLPLGCLDVGLLRHRALLFKVLADRINIPCMLVKGNCYTGTDDGALNFIKADDGSEYIIDMMGSPGALIPAEVPSSQLQNYSFAVRGCEEIVGLPNNTRLMLEDGPRVLGVSSDLGRISTVNGAQTEESFNWGSQTKPDEKIHVAIHETKRFGHNLGSLLQSLHKSSECSSHTEASSSEKIRVKNVSKYVLSAAKNPEFAQKLHTVLLESGALPPPDLFSDVNPQDTGEEKASEKIVGDTVQTDPDGLLLRCEKSCISFQGVVSDSDTRSCQSADRSAEQQEELHTDATRFYNSSECDNTRKGCVTVSNRVDELEQSDAIIVDRVSVDPYTMHKEQRLEPSLPKAAVSCKRHNGFNLSCDDDEDGFSNRVGAACSNTEFGENSVIQINETPNGDCMLYDCKNEKVNPGLAESTEWEIQWEDLHIGARIGIGSCGEVYRADCNGTEVAVKKFLDQDFSGDALAQFKSEVGIMLRLRHPNIVLFMGAITRLPHLSILTEFLPRGSLYRLLHHPKFLLDEKRRLRMALDVAKGMNCLHTNHPPIVHRDLKSPNLLVDKHWVVKVSDFGLSRLKHHTFLSSKSSAGTPEWMAPEVLRNEPASEKCDVYSFGVILWELATRKIPWKGLNPMQVVGAVGFQNRWLEIPEDVDPEVAQIIRDCWQMEPQLRPSFSQLVSRLSRLHHLVVEKTSSTH